MPIDGVARLRGGVRKKLTASELRRGYVFVSLDRRLPEAMDVKNFTAVINGAALPERKISSSGRVHVPPSVLAAAAGPSGTVDIQLLADGRLRIDPARGAE